MMASRRSASVSGGGGDGGGEGEGGGDDVIPHVCLRRWLRSLMYFWKLSQAAFVRLEAWKLRYF